MPKPKRPRGSRSGAVWTEDDYLAKGLRAINVRLPEELLERLDAKARKDKRARVVCIREAVKEWLAKPKL